MAATTIAVLPDDVIFDILVRVPDIKSVIRCNRVCKKWHNLILQPCFAGSLISRGSLPLSLIFYSPSDGPTDPAHFGILELDDDDLACLSRQNATVTFRSEIYIPHEGYKGRVIGACNGLVCLRVDYKDIVVCNPILQGRRPLVLPKLPKQAHCRSRFGFGFSPLSDEYKVLRCNETHEGHIISIEVFTLGRDDTWRSIDGGHNGKPFPRSCMSLGIDFVFLNGALYWLGREDIASRFLCYFDVENEELGSTLSLPCQIDGIVHLGVLDKFLYVFDVHWPSHVDVWVMRDYMHMGAWTWKWVLKLPYPRGLVGPIRPIKFLKDETVLMILNKYIAHKNKYGKVLASHNPQTGLTEIIKYHEVLFWTKSIAHTPSFLCPATLVAMKGSG